MTSIDRRTLITRTAALAAAGMGLHSFDPVTFKRSAKPSAGVLGGIARRNSL
jgi:hypothetical protein